MLVEDSCFSLKDNDGVSFLDGLVLIEEGFDFAGLVTDDESGSVFNSSNRKNLELQDNVPLR